MQLVLVPHFEEEEDEEESPITPLRSACKNTHTITTYADLKGKGVAASKEKIEEEKQRANRWGSPKEEEEAPLAATSTLKKDKIVEKEAPLPMVEYSSPFLELEEEVTRQLSRMYFSELRRILLQ